MGSLGGGRSSRTRRLLAVLALAGLGAAALAVAANGPAVLALVAHGRAEQPSHASAAVSPAPAAAAQASPTPDDQLAKAQAIVAPAAAPVRLILPSIRVDAAIEPVGVDGQGRMGTPARADDVAWFQPGTAPGDAGDAVIAGHLDWTTGPAVFWHLGSVRRGDRIAVGRADGTQVGFVVDATSMMPYNAPTDALFTRDGPPSLTLITCAGTWDTRRGTYLQRLVVPATLAADGMP